MVVNMSDIKQTEPTAVISSQQDAVRTEASTKSGKLNKKHVLIAGVSVIITGLVVTAVLVGIRMVLNSKEEILKLSLSVKNPGGGDFEQTISTDANANIVIYHVKENGLDITVNDDFDKDIQLMKVVSESSVECYVTPLNRSNSFDVSSLPLSSDYDPSTMVNITTYKTVSMSYEPAPTPINDTTFLGQRANALCNNIPIYWLIPTCVETVVEESSHAVDLQSNLGFSCSCVWKQCRKCIFGLCFTYTCGSTCTCCLNGKCLSFPLNPCILCWLAKPFVAVCSILCKLIMTILSNLSV